MSINIKNVLHAQAHLQEMYGNRQSGPEKTGHGSTAYDRNNRMADSITLSDTARHLARISASPTGEPLVNSQRVAEIRQALIEGSYRIDPVQIAEKVRSFNIRLH